MVILQQKLIKQHNCKGILQKMLTCLRHCHNQGMESNQHHSRALQLPELSTERISAMSKEIRGKREGQTWMEMTCGGLPGGVDAYMSQFMGNMPYMGFALGSFDV